MAKLKATERINYLISDLWDSGMKWSDRLNHVLFFTTLIPLAVYTIIIVVTGSFFNSTLPFASLFHDMSLIWTIISAITLPFIIPFIFLIIVWGIIFFIIYVIIEFFKTILFGK